MKRMMKFVGLGCVMGLWAVSAFGQTAASDLPYIKNPDDAAIAKTVTGVARSAEEIEKDKQAIIKAANDMIDAINQSGLPYVVDELAKGVDGQFGHYLRDFPAIQSLQILEPTKFINGSDVDAVKVVGSTLGDYVGSEWIDLNAFPDLAGYIYIAAMNAFVKTNQTTEFLHEIVWADPKWADNKPCRHVTYRKDVTYQGKTYWIWNSFWLDK